jgi:hypothetical protein
MVLSFGVLAIYSYRLKFRADRLVRVSDELSRQEYPPTLDEIRQQFGTELKQPDPCTPSGCGYEIILSNRLLAEIHMAPFTALRSYFWVRDGVLDGNMLVFWAADSQGRLAKVDIQTKYCDRCDSFTVVPCAGSIESDISGSVEIGYKSVAADRRAAFALDTSCLTKHAGCSTVAELLPPIWQRRTINSMTCRVAQH